MPLTSIAIEKEDHMRFLKAELEFIQKRGRKVSHAAFFSEVLNGYLEGCKCKNTK